MKYILVILAALFLVGCVSQQEQAQLSKAEQQLKALKEETDRLERQLITAPTPELQQSVAKRKEMEAQLKAQIEELKKLVAQGEGAPEAVLNTVVSVIPGLGTYGPLLGLGLGLFTTYLERRKRFRQLDETMTSVELLGGPTADVSRTLLLKAQSDDTIDYYKKHKQRIKSNAALLKTPV